MVVVKVKLFNTPNVIKDNSKVSFPFRKAEALFYYLYVNQQASRDELATLLWSDYDEASAKKYLRNAMYRIRKSLGVDIIVSPQKQVVMVNPQISIQSDLKEFLKQEKGGIRAYTGEFLKGFLIKDAENFTEWTRSKREYFRELYVSKLFKYLEKCSEGKASRNSIEGYSRLLIETDEFDERAYRILMRFYADEETFNKSIEVYNQLTEVLDRELGIAPEVKTKELYLKILEERNSNVRGLHPVTQDLFFGRKEELNLLISTFNDFVKGMETQSPIIFGEAGIGKTRLKEEFKKRIDMSRVFVLEAECYQAEEKYLLKPLNTAFARIYDIIKKESIDVPDLWMNIVANVFPYFATEQTKIGFNPVEKLDDLKPKVIEDTVIGILRRVAGKKKILFIVEDLQWIDQMSLSLLNNILMHTGNNIIIYGTVRNGYGRDIDKFLTLMSKYKRIKKIQLDRFNSKEVEKFVAMLLSETDYEITPAFQEKLYKETEGNTFFLIEFIATLKERGDIQLMTPRMQDILKSRILDISQRAKKVLNIISLFFDEIPLEILKLVSGESEFKIMDILEELKNKSLIREIEGTNKISYKITQKKLREYIYSQQSLGRRKILHNKIGLILERTLKGHKNDILIYPNLIYHFFNARNWKPTLKYSINNANVYLDFSHQLFPEFSETNIGGDSFLQITKDIAIKYINDIEEILDKVKAIEILSDEVVKLEVEFLHMKGRYLIREGEYGQGVKCIETVIEQSLNIKDYKNALKGYIQMIFFSIQTHNTDLMAKNLKPALSLARSERSQKDIATLLRLKGLNKVMTGSYREAERLLKQSIAIFSELNKKEEKYALCIAAAYNYIGEIRRHNREFDHAIGYYERALEISGDKKSFSSLAIFYTNAGQAAYDGGNYHHAKGYLQKAIEMYHQFDTLWGRSTAEGYKALLLIEEGLYEEALVSLKQADLYSKKLQSPYELGLVCRIKAEIKTKMNKNKRINRVFSQYLDRPLHEYCSCGIELLKNIKGSYEIKKLIALKNQ
jgi:DNA-binding SARP family transcriptional activator/predicted ATPase